IATDQYRLLVSPDGKLIQGNTRGKGDWANTIRGTQVTNNTPLMKSSETPTTATFPETANPPTVPTHIRELGFYEGRQEEHKSELLKLYGGNEASEAAVARALQWIVTHQQTDGGWTFDHNHASRGQGTGAGSAVEARNA